MIDIFLTGLLIRLSVFFSFRLLITRGQTVLAICALAPTRPRPVDIAVKSILIAFAIFLQAEGLPAIASFLRRRE